MSEDDDNIVIEGYQNVLFFLHVPYSSFINFRFNPNNSMLRGSALELVGLGPKYFAHL